VILRNRYLFPAIYVAFLLPAALGMPVEAKVAVLVTCPSLAVAINLRQTARIIVLLLTALSTLVPFLLLVQSAVCSSSMYAVSEPLVHCIVQRSFVVLLNVGLLSCVFMLAAANEWRGSLVATINRMCLPRSVRMTAIVSGAMIGEFRRAVIRVHHAFTARGDAVPSVNWRNLIVLPAMLGAVWASVLSGEVERVKGQWSSDRFWGRYVPAQRRADRRAATSDLVVLGAGGLLIAVLLVRARY
jgi:hypothetical protein